MKLSVAIRLGAMLKPQGFGSPYSGGDERKTQACALEGAALALGIKYDDLPFIDLQVTCPECGGPHQQYLNVFIAGHLNDAHHWTRERIADFVQSIEDQNPEIAAQPEVGTADPRVAEHVGC